MGILTGHEIRAAKASGRIIIEPCDPAQIVQVSVDLHLCPRLLAYGNGSGRVLDLATYAEPDREIVIPPEGVVLVPGMLYLGATIETIHAPTYAAIVAGKSSPARKGLRVEAAGLVEPGFRGSITLEIEVAVPLRVYAGWPIAQVRFETVEGLPEPYTERGTYQDQTDGPVASRSHLHKRRHVGGAS